MKSGIYKIENVENGKVYVGSSNDISKRWSHHRISLRENKHYNVHLQNAWNKYGEGEFTFEMIEVCEIEQLIIREQYWLDTTECYNKKNGYNIRHIAESNRGLEPWNKGQKFPQFSGENHHHYGKPMSDKTKQKLRDFYKENPHPSKGKKRPAEIGKRISIALTGKTPSAETREKIRQNTPGRKLNWEKVREIRKLYAAGNVSQEKLGMKFNITRTAIQAIVNGRNWKENT